MQSYISENTLTPYSNMETKMVFTIKVKSAQWYVKDIGPVRTESYNKKGKLTSYTDLTKLNK
ncbi:MAG: hypothetical protein PF487_04125 [Bacteroidales bacterium]|jgi:hypothetical protein|nr:hypothetical protein [Bacteroidales bacterium]